MENELLIGPRMGGDNTADPWPVAVEIFTLSGVNYEITTSTEDALAVRKTEDPGTYRLTNTASVKNHIIRSGTERLELRNSSTVFFPMSFEIEWVFDVGGTLTTETETLGPDETFTLSLVDWVSVKIKLPEASPL